MPFRLGILVTLILFVLEEQAGVSKVASHELGSQDDVSNVHDTCIRIGIFIIRFVTGVDIEDSSSVSDLNELIKECNLDAVIIVLTRIWPKTVYIARWFKPEAVGEDKVVFLRSIGGKLRDFSEAERLRA